MTERFGSRLHHRDVLGLALRRLEQEMDSGKLEEAYGDLAKQLDTHNGDSARVVAANG